MGAAKDLTIMGLATTQMRKYAKEIGDLLSQWSESGGFSLNQ